MVFGVPNPLNVRIEPSRPELVESFRECLDAVCRERRFLGFADAPPLEQVREFVEDGLANGMIQHYALDDGRVVGWCDVRPGRREGLTHSGTLGMGVLAPYRGRGVGSRLIEWTLNAAWAVGMTRVHLEVFENNEPAIGLYEKFGFEVEGRKVSGRKVEGVCEDILVMGLLRDG